MLGSVNALKNKLVLYAQEFHLYTSKSEIMLRLIVWGLSWVFGILSLFIKDKIQDSGYSFFIFSLTVLLEFAPQIHSKKRLFGRIIHVIFCLSMIFLLFISSISIFTTFKDETWYYLMLVISVLPILYLVIGFLALWLNGDGEEQPSSDYDQELIKIYMRNSKQGALGNVNKGD